MPANTGGGYPYPLPTEPVKDGANAIKLLADAIDARAGTYLETTVSATVPVGTGGWYTISGFTQYKERDSLGYCHSDSTSAIIDRAGLWEIQIQFKWSSGGAQAGRRYVGWAALGSNPSTWQQSTIPYIPGNGGIQMHRETVNIVSPTRVCAMCYQDSGSVVNVDGSRVIIRYLAPL